MEVSGYLHAFGRFVLAKDLLVFIGWEVGGLLIWFGHNGRGKNVLPSYWCAEIRMSVSFCCTSHVLTKYCVADADAMFTYMMFTDRYFAVAFSL